MVAKVLSYIPLFTPFTMMNRAGGPPEPYEYVVTSALLLVSIWIAFRAAGKVFRIGVLMTGNPPKLKEIISWLRER
jgi:ABC-2 type transport system permease protein